MVSGLIDRCSSVQLAVAFPMVHHNTGGGGVGKGGLKGAVAPLIFYAVAPLVFFVAVLMAYIIFDSTHLFKFVSVDLWFFLNVANSRDYIIQIT